MLLLKSARQRKEAIKIKNFSQVKNAVELLVLTYKPSVVYAGYISEDGVVVYASKYSDINIFVTMILVLQNWTDS